jgi:1,4-alpha-glucan branching enzyme
MTVDRGIALHKMIRLVTLALGGEAYLAFMGNEWGHPEWVDFPRPGNNNSYDKCRRRWDLLEDKLLRYQHMYNLDKAMLRLANQHPFLHTREFVIVKHESNKMIAFERGEFYWIFNFHPHQSYPDFRVGVTHPGKYEIVLDTDSAEFGGHTRLQKDVSFFTEPKPWDDRPNSMLIYSPCRAALVLRRVQE